MKIVLGLSHFLKSLKLWVVRVACSRNLRIYTILDHYKGHNFSQKIISTFSIMNYTNDFCFAIHTFSGIVVTSTFYLFII